MICTSEPQPIFAKQSSARRVKSKAKNTFFDLDFRAAAYHREAKRARRAKSKAKNTFFDLDFRAAAYLREAKRARRVKSKAKNTFPNFVNASPNQMT
ncbi:MAG: hypothetical protein EGQ88_00760 [Prevotellamassilia timonensis]|nr:hypothetical protein [Prevotellamassilia timonensis]